MGGPCDKAGLSFSMSLRFDSLGSIPLLRMIRLIRKDHDESPVSDHRSDIFVECVLPISLEMLGQFVQVPVSNTAQPLDEILHCLLRCFFG